MSLERTLQQQRAAKYDNALEVELRRWIEEQIGQPELCADEKPFAELLKDGTILCEVINSIIPNRIKRINKTKLPFKQIVRNLNPLTRGKYFKLFNHLHESRSA